MRDVDSLDEGVAGGGADGRSREKAAATLSLRYCSECGRTDRFNKLPETHYTRGRRCDGPLWVAVYRFDRTMEAT